MVRSSAPRVLRRIGVHLDSRPRPGESLRQNTVSSRASASSGPLL
ncbi:hypothetical protein [Pseudenhygromyxa sp. WMMC2535]|nr:hypothetical protein [Pseudenhygromyxa sp. WMMC2535]